MTEVRTPIDALRREIDEIDDSIHDLLMRRALVVERLLSAKATGGVATYQPAREASILRRLVARHRGALPKSAVVPVWREIMAVFVRLQGPFSLALEGAANAAGMTALARAHFGSGTPVTACETAVSVIEAVASGAATVGVVPIPGEAETDPWWPALGQSGDGAPRIIGRLPFAPREGDGPGALAIGRIGQEGTGADHSFILVDMTGQSGRTEIESALAAAGLAASVMASHEGSDGTRHLIEVSEFVGSDDPRIGKLIAVLGPSARSAAAVGGYPLPFSPADLATPAESE